MPAHDSAAFISYIREGLEFALRLARDLKAAGGHVWLHRISGANQYGVATSGTRTTPCNLN